MPKYKLVLLNHIQMKVDEIPCEEVNLGMTLAILAKPEDLPALRKIVKNRMSKIDYENVVLLPQDVRFAVLEETNE